MEFVATLAAPLVVWATKTAIMGMSESKHAEDMANLMEQNERAMDRRDVAFREHLNTLNGQHEEQLERLQEDMDRRESAVSEQYERIHEQSQEQLREMRKANEKDKQRMETLMREQAKLGVEQQKKLSKEHKKQMDGIREDMAKRERTYAEQQRKINQQHEQQMEDMKEANAEEKRRLETQFEQQQAQMRKEMKAERGKYEERIRVMEDTMKEAKERVEQLQLELEKPIRNRQAKIRFVNMLRLHVHESEDILLAGPKGMGKSTFMWLLNRGEKPEQSFSDGTVKILQLDGFVDSIGLRGWTPEEIVKLMVLLIYDGIPRDLIIFGNDRIDLPVTSLGLLGINNPMIVLLSGDFWKNYNKNRIHLMETRTGARRVNPEGDLDLVYNLDLYNDIVKFGLGKPITHHDNLEALFEERRKAGVHPFKFLLQKLGNVFTAEMDNDNTVEAIFRFIYIYEKKYNRDTLKFMNNATLQDFAALE